MTSGHRLVSSAEAASAADAARLVEQDSGGALIAGQVEKVNGGWRVTVWSADGHNRLPSAHASADPGLTERRTFESVGQEPCGFWEPRNNPRKPAGQQ